MAEKKVIWITGASSGIGKALAIKFAENGWIVAASARRENLLKELQNINQNIYPYPLDVTDIEKCKLTAKSIIDNLNDIDICVFGTGMHDPKSEKQFNLNKIREIISYCDLEWQQNCLEFYKNKKSIKTVSFMQARKPIYKDSLKGSIKFKKYLKELEGSLKS